MTHESDEDWDGEDRPVSLQRRRRAPIVLALLAGLTLAGIGAAFLWMNIDSVAARLLSRETSESAEPATGDKAMLTDMLATQQKTGEDLEAVSRTVADQQEQLKTIVDQLAALTSRIEELRNAAPLGAAPPNAVPPFVSAAPPSLPPSAATPPDVRAQVAPKAAKKRGPKPTGPISVGGAPLTAAPRAESPAASPAR
jgi:uncharacterized coiled-coil protein SlyX